MSEIHYTTGLNKNQPSVVRITFFCNINLHWHRIYNVPLSLFLYRVMDNVTVAGYMYNYYFKEELVRHR